MDILAVLKREHLEHLNLKPAVTAEVDTPLNEVIDRMRQGRSGCATVIQNGEVKGVFTERDLIVKVLTKDVDLSCAVETVMTKDPHVLRPHDSVAQAIELINQYGHRSIPVVDDKKRFMGLVSVRTIITFLAEHFPAEVYNLPPSHELKDYTREGG